MSRKPLIVMSRPGRERCHVDNFLYPQRRSVSDVTRSFNGGPRRSGAGKQGVSDVTCSLPPALPVPMMAMLPVMLLVRPAALLRGR